VDGTRNLDLQFRVDNVNSSCTRNSVVLSGSGLTIDHLMSVSRQGAQVLLTEDPLVLLGVRQSREWVAGAVERGETIYGVTSGFGGMAGVAISPQDASLLQNNLPWFLKTGAGPLLPAADVRATMVLRANALLRGASGIRLEIIERLLQFLNAGVLPQMRSLGSIGASGDLVPLAAIAGAIQGAGDSFLVDFDGRTMPAPEALRILGLAPLPLLAKEGLALVNGTAALTGIAAGCLYDGRVLQALTLGVHALALQALGGSNQSFHVYIHRHKPHPGQRFTAAQMLALLAGSRLIRNELGGQHRYEEGRLLQDRYSIRCLPQFLGPLIDGMALISSQVEVEMNSATDNPLIDAAFGMSFHGGNFLGQYVAVGMDQFRYYLGLMAKHLDVQLALLMEPCFSGLPGSLVGNSDRRVNMGLKGLQITGNSIMPMIAHLGNSLADRFPTHAEQFNQNINSLGFGSANLSRQSIQLFQQYLAVALVMVVQAVALRTKLQAGHYDARSLLAPGLTPLYEAVWKAVGREPLADRPLIFNDDEQALDEYLLAISNEIAAGGDLPQSLAMLIEHIGAWQPWHCTL